MSKDFCHNCGLCCMHMRTPPFIGGDDPEWNNLDPALKKEIDDFVIGNPSPRYELMVAHEGAINPCIWLDLITGKCKHYEHRPSVCRDFHVGCESCRGSRKEVGLTIEGMPVVDETYAFESKAVPQGEQR